MGRPRETFGKKEIRSKQEKKRKEKVAKRLEKKDGRDGNNLDEMIAYVDEYGRITDTPPDPSKKIHIEASDIEISITKSEPSQKNDFMRKGVVTFFNDSKGFGFIRDMESKQSVFVHANNLEGIIKENNIVTFEIGKGPKGLTALKVKLFKE